jgi:hypothetical protein
MADVHVLGVVTKLDLPAERILTGALAAELNSAVVIGWDGGDLYFASSIANGAEVLWLLEEAKIQLMAKGRE